MAAHTHTHWHTGVCGCNMYTCVAVCVSTWGSQVQQGHTWQALAESWLKLKPHSSLPRNFCLPLYALLIFYGPNENFHSRFMRQPTKCSSAELQNRSISTREM